MGYWFPATTGEVYVRSPWETTMPHRAILTSLALVLSSFLVVGCGGSSPTSPTQDGVNLTGQFVSDGSSPLALRAQFSTDLGGVTVEVLDSDGNDTGISVAVGSDGSFTLRGLPEGAFTLIFRDESGTRIGRIRFKEVMPNQQISILVDLSDDGTVSLLSEKRNGIGHGDVELEGMASDVQLEDGHANNGTLRVNGELVVSSGGETAIRKGSRRINLEDVEGKRVHVKGEWRMEDGTQVVFAWEIKLQEEEDRTDVGDRNVPECSSPDPKNSNKLLVCHKDKKTLSISKSAWPAHYSHGDSCRECPKASHTFF
jgi:hypothetical protein